MTIEIIFFALLFGAITCGVGFELGRWVERDRWLEAQRTGNFPPHPNFPNPPDQWKEH